MKFRFVLLNPDDDPSPSTPPPECDDGLLRNTSELMRYERRGAGMARIEPLENGRTRVTPVANFQARIVSDLMVDDGDQEQRAFSLEAEVAGQRIAFSVSAVEFAGMGWVLKRLGPQAIVYPGQQQHARAAIQWLSGPIPQERIFAHLGWRKQGRHWVYLHAGGALSGDGPLPGVQVQLPAALQSYHLLPSDQAGERVSAVRSSLQFLSLAPDRITFPLLAAVYRAPLGRVDFSLFLTGKTGVFKTALAALCQQHLGAAMDASRLPGHFASTANALEELAFQAKDALLVIDDFAPSGGAGDDALEAIAERLFRGAGNGQGRSRMRGPQLRAPRPPRALLLATGEEVPRGHSIRARLLIVELRPGEVDLAALSRCQMAGQKGQLATAMGAYLAWMARDYENLQDLLRRRSRELRGGAPVLASAIHARLPGIVGELQSGWETWLQFALEVGAISNPEQVELKHRGRKALDEVAAMQSSYHQASDPALRFVSLLQAALACGRAHVADRRGVVPESPERWGWRRKPNGRAWLPQGTRIGWLTGRDVFLEPAASYQVAQQMAGPERLPVGVQTLRQRLREHGLLVSTDVGRQMLLVRRILEGCPRKVLHLKGSHLVGVVAESGRRES
jgi:hypothetical protein